MEFLPVNRRTFPELSAHLKRNGLDAVVDYYQKQRATEISRATSAHLRDMISGTDANEEVRLRSFLRNIDLTRRGQIIAYLKEQERTKTMPETDFLNLVWNGLVSSIDIAELQEKAGETLLKELKVSRRTNCVLFRSHWEKRKLLLFQSRSVRMLARK